jgi:hypothetical protein
MCHTVEEGAAQTANILARESTLVYYKPVGSMVESVFSTAKLDSLHRAG